MPVIFEAPQLNTVGAYWQGRYWLPLIVGLPLIASSVPPRLRAGPAPFAAHSWSGRMARFLAVGAMLLAAQVGAFLPRAAPLRDGPRNEAGWCGRLVRRRVAGLW